MAGTKINAVRAAVIAGVAAETEFADVAASMAYDPNAREAERLFTIWPRISHRPASLRSGRTHREETGSFRMVITVQSIGETLTTASDRAVALGLVAEEWVADHRSTHGVAGVNWLVVDGEVELDERLDDRSSLAVLSYTVAYAARLD